MDLFDIAREENLKTKAPLAQRMKPKTLEDFVGQEKILGEGKLLRRLIEADRLTSVLFHGPSGTGKTSLAVIISHLTESHFVTLNAVTSGVKDIKEVVEGAKDRLSQYGRRTILFVDEIHRFNKSQQDALLPHVEEGTVILIGATTENPYFEVNSALLSRSMIFELELLSDEALSTLIHKALSEDVELKEKDIRLDDAGKAFIIKHAKGDARRALNILELAALTTEEDSSGKLIITEEILSQCTQKPFFNYDKRGDYHYDVISAFIKSVRGSDPQASLFYMTQMLLSGEDPKFIARRLVILAAEDIGLADPQALVIANAGFDVVTKIGMPEARIVLSEVAIYLSLTDKSNSAYRAIGEAYSLLQEKGQGAVPDHLRDATNKKLRSIDIGYDYPHSYPKAYVEQTYLPEGYEDITFYEEKHQGKENELVKRWKERKK